MTDDELVAYFHAAGWSPYVVDVEATEDPDALLAETLDRTHAEIRAVRERRPNRPLWPMILLRSPKGWGVPAENTAGEPLAGTFRAHQVPLDADELALLEDWLRSYRPDELLTEDGRPRDDLLADLPPEQLRLGRVPQANGGLLRQDLPLPPVDRFAVDVPRPGAAQASPTGAAGAWLAELMRATAGRRDFRVVCPDELASNKLDARADGDGPGVRVAGRPTTPSTSVRDGRVHGGAVRAPVPGLAAGLPAHRPARAVPVLRGLRRPSWTAWSTSTPSS